MRRVHRIHALLTNNQALRLGFLFALVFGLILVARDAKRSKTGMTPVHVSFTGLILGTGAWLLKKPVLPEKGGEA